MGDTTGRYDNWAETEIDGMAGGADPDGFLAWVELIHYEWYGKQEDPRPDDAKETRIKLIREDLCST